MRIKKIELVGFKSFKDRTVIHFDEGVTGIVGPNGCGKSNIVDAITWVMGEQSAKHLRGSSMEDVIFGGAEGYAPSGMAEVSMTLENDGGPFPAKYIQHSEVQVTRRLHRSGESEYLVNREHARLRDIHEIFMDTGAGSKGFSIIEQGAIGKIITAKPIDRRVLIEEAAGITKFKVRKKESQRKLQATDQNLVRLRDIISELKRQIDSLQRQAKRAERYRELKENIEDLDLLVSTKDYKNIKDELEQLNKEFNLDQDSQTETQTKLDALRSEVETLQLQLVEKAEEVEHKNALFMERQSQVREKENCIQRLSFEIEEAQRNAQRQGSMAEESQAKKSVLENQLAEITSEHEELTKEVESLQKSYDDKQGEFARVNARVSEIDEELTAIRRDLIAVSQAEIQVEQNINAVNVRIEENTKRQSEMEGVLSELKAKKQAFDKRYQTISAELEGERQLHLNIMSDVKNFEENKQTLQQQLETKRQEVENFKDELNQVSSRLYGLEDLQTNFEGFQEGVKNVMMWKKSLKEIHSDGRVSEVVPVAEVVEVPQEYEVAMEAALGNKLQMLLSENSQESVNAVHYLKEKNAGRSSFLSGDVATAHRSEHNPEREEGVRCVLSQVVRSPEQYQSSVNLLVGDVVIVESISTALRLRPHYQGWSFVTADGDVLSADGVLTGGASEDVESGVLKRRREIKELSQRKDEMAGKLSLAQASLKKIEERFKNIETELEASRKNQNEKEVRVTEIQKDFERAQAEVNSAQEAIDRQYKEIEGVLETKSRLGDSKREEDARLQEFRSKKGSLETKSNSLNQEYEDSKNGIENLRDTATQAQIALAGRKEAQEGVTRRLEMVQSSLNEVLEQLGRMNQESQQTSEILDSNQVRLEQEKVELEKILLEVQTLEKDLSVVRNTHSQISNDVLDRKNQMNEIQRIENEKQARLNEAKLKVEQYQMKLQYIEEQIQERYMRSLKDVYSQYVDRECDLKETKRELETLKARLKKIGEVNLSAIQEYDEIKDRYEFLTKQEEDLVEAKDQLRRVIDRINRICNRRFKDTFEAVNERFKKVFPVLFGGGEAQLILIHIEDKDEMGIDIMAKPPGKKTQNITLMSGGEKALTSVALIFSIFLVKPSPFCLLDEVDAPLDDANVYRFNDLVQEMAKRSQIIIVTHNKHTMEINDKLYGVTMQEKGVSKMVSVSLDEAQTVVN